MIKSLHEACSRKCLGYDFRREETSQFLRSNMKSIRCIDNDLALPLLKLLRDILVGGKWDSEEDDLSLKSVLNRLRNNARTEFFSQRRKGLRSTRVCNCEVHIFPRKDACERSTNISGTNDGILHRNSPDFQ